MSSGYVLPLLLILSTTGYAASAQPESVSKQLENQTMTKNQASSRVLLEGVPKIGCYGSNGQWNVEENLFPSCMRAFLQYKGKQGEFNHLVTNFDPWHKAYINMMGASGATFRLLWKPDWSFGSIVFTAMATDRLEPIRRTFDSLGYSYQMLFKSDYAAYLQIKQDSPTTEADFKQCILESLRRGNPVIALGVVGPDYCLITGYDESNDAVLGWSYFQDDPEFKVPTEPSGYFKKTDWFKDTQAIFIPGEQQKAPSMKETYLKSLKWALQVMRTPEVHGLKSGSAAYTAWAEALRKDDFPKDDQAVLRKRYSAHKLSGLTVAEGRAWGSLYLQTIAEAYPEAAKELRSAAECFDAEHDLVWAIWEFTGGDSWSDESVKKFGEPHVRSRMAPLVRLAGKLDAEAADHIENAIQQIESKH